MNNFPVRENFINAIPGDGMYWTIVENSASSVLQIQFSSADILEFVGDYCPINFRTDKLLLQYDENLFP